MTTQTRRAQHQAALRAAFPHTIPILTGYLVLGTAFGILITTAGFSIWWAIGTSVFIYAGGVQFLAVSLITLGVSPLYAFLMSIMVNARHLFYGMSSLETFRGTGRYKPYLIFGLTDETFSVICSAKPPEEVDRTLFYFYVTLLDHLYWIGGSAIGGLAGGFLSGLDTTGFDFVLTALFTVIFLNQWRATQNHLPAVVGVAATVLCLVLFGADRFLLPAMGLILLVVTLMQKPMRKEKLL
ncbi:AzlC family ABC transporter permease [Feifania hominis]|uniref:AzlC family ABC transporter permease n=1 Tax=Feifania hominis TaxID=2763660 RepID=A0A926HQ09_9FIRM|nr:AzlC family ABC transporter permease [Feifania hominis]MBC8535847.1 AzlC family ABC transporter permease [Feifania hominis]